MPAGPASARVMPSRKNRQCRSAKLRRPGERVFRCCRRLGSRAHLFPGLTGLRRSSSPYERAIAAILTTIIVHQFASEAPAACSSNEVTAGR